MFLVETTDEHSLGNDCSESKAVRYVFRDGADSDSPEPETKPCPFCAEPIQAKAIKCRLCGELLIGDRAEALLCRAEREPGQGDKEDDGLLFKGRPSLWGLTGAAIKGLVVLGAAVLLMWYPVEDLPIFRLDEAAVSADLGEAVVDEAGYGGLEDEALVSADSGAVVVDETVVGTLEEEASVWADSGVGVESEAMPEAVEEESPKRGFGLTEEQALIFGMCRVATGAALAGLVLLVLLMKVVKRKMTYYKVTGDRIEWGRGILDRKVDNLDMFRVVDLRLRRSILDCMVGIGTLVLMTTDKTDPKFTFENVHNSRRLYDIIKKATRSLPSRMYTTAAGCTT